jgi:hypothetical protein
MAVVPYSRLADLFSLSQLPAPLALVQQAAATALEDVFYRNFDITPQVEAGAFSATLEIVSYKGLALDVAATGFRLVLNPDGLTNDGYSVIPISFGYSLGILQWLPQFDLATVPTSAGDFFQLALDVTKVTELQLLIQALTAFERDAAFTDFPQVLASFRDKAQAAYGQANGLQIPPALPVDAVAALNQIVDAFEATTAGPAPVTLAQAILELYILDADASQALQNVEQLLLLAMGTNPLALLKRLLIPQISAQARVSVGLEVPRNILLPMVQDATTGLYKLDPSPDARVTILFAEGILNFNTEGGFGYDVEVAATLKRAQLGDTGLQVAFTSAKLDLSDNTNIAEADADGRPQDFKGLYAKQVDVFLPDAWTTQPGSVQLSASDLLVGTGGVSGRFGVKSGSTSTLASGALIEARLLGQLKVKFTSFDVTFSRGDVVSSAIKGTFTLDSFRAPNGQPAPFAFELSYTRDGYALVFNAPVVKGKAVPVTVALGAVGSVHFTKLAFTKKGADWALDLVADIEPGRALPIIGRALPSHVVISNLHVGTDEVTITAKPTWADGTQLTLDDKNPSVNLALDKTILNILHVEHLRFTLTKAGTNRSLLATFDAELGLTPDSTGSSSKPDKNNVPPPGVHARITNAGFRANVSPTPDGSGNLGLAQVGLGVQLPDSASLTVNVGGLVGSGSLAILDNGARYEGVLDLTFNKTLHLAAYGILQQNLPGGGEGPSLLALITAQFNPIELGLGFTLNAVGGLLGLHRSVDTQYLLGMVRQGELKKLLFPEAKDPDHRQLSELKETLALINLAFPAAPGRYIIGLMAQLGWGTRTLITLDVALLVEMPSPLRLAVLGVLQAVLPGAPGQDDLLKLRADFLGTIDFGAKKVAFDASLVQSHILKYTLTGDMAFRLYQGDNPLFVITAGGFHPAFQPPAGANLTGLKRLTLNLSQSSDLQLTLASYFAVTSNTVQFGAHLDLVYRIGRGFRVDGHFGFDVLFQFSPFRLLAHVEAGVAIKAGSSELLSLHLALDVAGPGPWHVWGEASFRIWFVKISVDVNATIGDNSPETTAPQLAPDVATPLRAALRDAASWEVETPQTTVQPGGVVLRPADTAAGQLFLDPRGALVVRQHVAPLGLELEKFGNSQVAPTGGTYFRLTGLLLNGEEYPGTAHEGSTEPVSEFFVPEQFRRLTDAQKLSLPSFQLLPCGLRLKSLASLSASAQAEAALRVVEYEQKIISGQSGGHQGAPTKLRPTAAAFQQLARGGALGQALEAARPSSRAPRPVGWEEDTYEVVRADTLAVYSKETENQKFKSQVQAEQYCQQVVAAHPELAGELLLVPTYELTLA